MKRDIGFRLLNTCIYAAILVVAGCKSIGPAAIKRDRLHYSTAVSDSWKEQLLLNIVKTRYGDAPAFMEVVSVVSGYSLETGVSWRQASASTGNFPRRICGATHLSRAGCRARTRIVPPSATRR